MIRFTVALAAAALASCATAPPRGWSATTLVSYPHGTFLENMASDGGRLVVTDYTGKRLIAWDRAGAPRPWLDLDVHPVGIVRWGDGWVLSAHGSSFLAGPAFQSTNMLIVLDAAGRVVRRTPAPDARFLNGVVALPDGSLLVADSGAGRIWRYRPDEGALTPWLADPLFEPSPAAAGRPGINGLKLSGGHLYFSNSGQGIIGRIAIDGASPAGAPTGQARTGPVDDFAFLGDGSIVATTHGTTLLRVDSAGQSSTILAEGCDGCTAVVVGPGEELFVTTTGGLVEGMSQPARILRLVPGR